MKEFMRILMLCYEFPPIGGGGAKVAYGLSRELVHMGNEVDLVSMGYQRLPKDEYVDGIHVIRLPCIRTSIHSCKTSEAATYMLSSALTKRRLARSKQYDLIHAHFILPDGFLAWQIRKFAALPYIITAHGSDVPGYNPHRLKLAHRMVAPVWTIVTKNASKIICPSKILRALVLKKNKYLNVEIISNGIDTERFVANREKGNRILIVSRMIERKGIQFFLKAIAQTAFDWEVHIVGDGPYLHKLQEKAMGAKCKIKFWGWLDRESHELKELYETSSVFVFPSEAENFPIVLLEAMASGLAIITTEGTGCEEVVGDAAVLVPPRNSSAILNALLLMLQNPEERRKMGVAARNRVEKWFSWTAISEQYIKLYKNTLVEFKTKL